MELSPTFNGLLTGLLLLMFIGIWAWSWSAKRRPDFERMANMPLEDDLPDTANTKSKQTTQDSHSKTEEASL